MSENFLDLEQAENFAEVLRDNGITAFGFDLDDTLIGTAPLFDRCFDEYCDQVGVCYGLEAAHVKDLVVKHNIAAYAHHGIRHSRWQAISEAIQAEYGFDNAFHAHADIFMKVYEMVPDLMPGSLDLLHYLQLEGFKVGLVTHAYEDWTHFKLEAHQLHQYFDQIVIADVNRPKDPQDWVELTTRLHVDTDEIIVVGDNRVGDIQAAHLAGIKHKVLLPPVWQVYSTGDIPEGTVLSASLLELPDNLLRYFLGG